MARTAPVEETRPMLSRLTVPLLALAAFSLPALAQSAIAREGAGDRRDALDAMELTPFDDALWSGLADWRIGDAVTPADTTGKVVLIYTFSGYLPTAVRPMTIVNRLAQSYGSDGLIVVGVHTDEAYEEGVSAAERRRASFPIARDTGNAMRDALKVDQDPDFYVIDRAGRLRFADIETASLERAISTLVDESADDAETLLDRRADAEARAAVDARRTARLRNQIDLSDLPWVPFTPPSPEAYERAEWPKVEEPENNSRRRSRNSQPAGPVRIAFNEGLDWHPNPPRNAEGRARLLYLFTDEVISDFNIAGTSPAAFFAAMDQMQTERYRDLVVVGAMIPKTQENNRRRRGNAEPDADRAKKAAEVFENVTRNMPVNHLRVNDFAGTTLTSGLTPNNPDGSRSGSRNNTFVLPYHILIDSSGVVRWHGNISMSAQRFAAWEAALEKVIENDPGIKARRAAEQAYIQQLTE
jgi:hypothetical protein